MELETQHKTERDGHIRARIKAILFRGKCWEITLIVQALWIHEDTVCRYVQDCFTENKFKSAHGNSKPKLDAEQTSASMRRTEHNLYVRMDEVLPFMNGAHPNHGYN